jgi:hypothetical protein
LSSKSSWFAIGSSVLPDLSGEDGESSVIKSAREGLPRILKEAEINHTKFPTCKSELGAASTRESCCYKISVRNFVAITTKHRITFDIISSSKPAAKVKFPGNDACACKDTCSGSDSLEWKLWELEGLLVRIRGIISGGSYGVYLSVDPEALKGEVVTRDDPGDIGLLAR